MIIEKKSRVENEIPSASMADIAFLLLVFFLTTTVFNEENGLELLLPEAKAEEIQVSQKNMRQEISMNPLIIAAVKTVPDARYYHMIAVLDELREAEAGRISLQMYGEE